MGGWVPLDLENPVVQGGGCIFVETKETGLESWIWDPVSPISVGLQALTSVCRLTDPGSGWVVAGSQGWVPKRSYLRWGCW